MDVCKLLKNVNNLNAYISATQDIINKFSNSKIQFNVSTIFALNKIRSIEIEYFNKCGENGAAIKILDLILRLPPSKTWCLLGKEIVSLIQYWLDALRKHLIAHNNHWWNFLSILLKYIKEIHLKSTSINDTLVLQMAECLLDIASTNQPDLTQRYKTIKCLNYISAESKREIRFSLRNKFDNYFVKLSSIMASCGDLRTQLSIMETLLRWLLPRQDMAVRREASIKWFPSSLCSSQAVEIFLQRPWQNFFKDARDFLNAFNEASNLVTSVLCRRLVIGSVVLISGTDKNDYWIDLNSGGKCISLMLESRLLEILGSSTSLCDALVISEDNTNNVQMSSHSSEILISLTVMDTLRVYRSNVLESCDVTIAISTRSDLSKVDRALRNIFDTKYQLLVDIEDSIELSPRDKRLSTKIDKMMVDDPRFSHPLERRWKQSGYIIKPRKPTSLQSPSTASTSSLAMLREKLAAFPGYQFEKEPVSVCALPQLSNVTELSETDEQNNFNASLSTLKLCSYGICHKKKGKDKKAVSDSECSKERHNKSRIDDIYNDTKNTSKCISPINKNDDDSISCLLVATTGSANDSVINDRLERLPNDKDIHIDNIVDLLAQEAMLSKRQIEEDKISSVIATGNNEIEALDTDAIENTPCINNANNSKKPRVNKKRIRVHNSTTTDESNTDVVEDTPNIDNVRATNVPKSKESNQTFDVIAVEDFFSQHFSENRHGDLVISPTLAKKINETSSESSGSLDFGPITNVVADFDEIEIIECLNEIVDRVCKDFEKCAEYLNDCVIINNNNDEVNVRNKVTSQDMNKEKSKRKPNPVKNIKLKYANTKKQTKTLGNKKLNMANVRKMSPIIEMDSVIEDTGAKGSPEMPPKKCDDYETPLIKRKRKLYSPKDDHLVNKRIGYIHVSETDEDNTILSDVKTYERTPKSVATSYKDIENLRKSIRKLRDRTSKSAPSFSPRTKKMNDVFDLLKKPVEGEEKVTLAKRKTRNKQFAVYNFSSDSDDDFKIKKITKDSRTTTKDSEESTVRSKRSKTKVNYSELNNESTDDQSNKNVKRKPVRQKSNKDRHRRTLKRKNEMIDEKMREAAKEILNTSIVIDPPNEDSTEPDPTHILPRMEYIHNEAQQENEAVIKNKISKRNKELSLKKVKNKKTEEVTEITSDRDKTDSPLPGLLVETEQELRDADESIKALMNEKFNDICNEGPMPDIYEVYTTQNLLSDLDTNTDSPPKLKKSDNLKQVTENQQFKLTCLRSSKNDVHNANKSKNKREHRNSISNIEIFEELEPIEGISEKTITTVGKSPITAHGDVIESPPCTKQLIQTFHDRSLETQNLNKSMRAYFHKLTDELNKASNDDSISNDSDNLNITEKKMAEKASNKSNSSSLERSPTVSITRLTLNEINQWQPPRYNSVFGSNQSSGSKVSVRKTSSYTRKYNTNDDTSKLEKNTQDNDKQIIYKSTISPVRPYGEFSGKEKSIPAQDDDYIERIKSLMTSKKQISKPEICLSKSSRYDLRKYDKKQEASCSRISEISKSTDVEEPGNSDRGKFSTPEVAKKRKMEDVNSLESVHIAETSASRSSVHDWLKTVERERLNINAESLDLSSKDNLEHIIEKLDTTLVEIHHSTSKKFVSMFVETQKQLNDLKARRITMFKETARDVMAEFVKIIDSKFASFDRRSEELDEKFMADIKEKARNLVHEDCKQKRVMVTLLKEDIQAVMENKKTSSYLGPEC